MNMTFMDTAPPDFDPEMYIQILIAIAKADKGNGPPEYAFVSRRAQWLGLDYDYYEKCTDKDYAIEKQKVSRATALVVLGDAIMLASMDRNFSLPEKQRIYEYAARLDIPRRDIDVLEELIDDYRRLEGRWRRLINLP